MKRTPKPSKGSGATSRVDPRFARVVAAFAKHRDVTRGGKGFGSTGLKVNGKLFAFISSRGKFVAKLPRERVDELVSASQGEHFDPGHGRVMKEWIAVDPGRADLVELARAAYRFARGGKAWPSRGVKGDWSVPRIRP
jgi:hypothetical protein